VSAREADEQAPPVSTFFDEHIYGFGQTVTRGLSAVGSTKFLATFSMTTDKGPSHAPAPFYISVGKAGSKSVSHGFFLNTHGYSAFDVGSSVNDALLVSSPDPVLDYFLFAGPTVREVVQQFTTVTGKMTIPPKWAMGLKYDPWDSHQNQAFVESIVRLATHFRTFASLFSPFLFVIAFGDRLVLLEGPPPQYYWDSSRTTLVNQYVHPLECPIFRSLPP